MFQMEKKSLLDITKSFEATDSCRAKNKSNRKHVFTAV